MLSLRKFVKGPWEQVRDYLWEDLVAIERTINVRWAQVFTNNPTTGNPNQLSSSVFPGDATTPTRYVANNGALGNIAQWALVNLVNGVMNKLGFVNFVASTAASRLVGRGSAAGAGDFQEITLGPDLVMAGTVLDLVQASAASLLLGRGSAAGSGEYQEITLGNGLSMSGTVLKNSLPGFRWSVLTNGSGAWPELVFDSNGDVIMTQNPLD